MLTNDLIASLNRQAAEVGQPRADLLTRVEQHADRLRKRQIAVIASISLLALVAAGTGLSLARHGQGTTKTIGPARVIAPAPCDEPGSVMPQIYLDWPCVPAADDTTAARIASLEAGLHRGFYAGMGDLKVRLLADSRHDGDTDRDDGSADTMIEAWYAGSTRPAVIADLFGNRTGLNYAGLSAASAPAGNPAIAFQPSSGSTQRRLYTRPDVATVILARTDGTSTSTPDSGVDTVHYPPLQGDGTEPGWRVIALARDGRTLANVPFDTNPDPPARVASPAPGAPRDLCEDPVAYGQLSHLDWPCATPSDGQVQERVEAIVAGLLSHYPSIKTPHVRLLADTLGAVDRPPVTEIEVWDASDPRSAVLTGSFDDNAMVVFSNDPAIVVDNTSSDVAGGRDFVAYVRSGIASLSFAHDGAVDHVAVHGGVAALRTSSSNLSGIAGWTLTGLDATGRQVVETPFDVGGCAKAQRTPCNPLATPATGH